jgi:hypothetical protein
MPEVALVAKKRGPKPKISDKRESLITMRCREEFRAWVFRVAGERRITPSQLIEFALMRYADFEKIEGPPKR